LLYNMKLKLLYNLFSKVFSYCHLQMNQTPQNIMTFQNVMFPTDFKAYFFLNNLLH